MDTSLFFLINKGMANSLFDAVMPFVSDNAHILLLIVVLSGLLKEKKKGLTVFAICLVALAFSDASSNLLKHLLQRQRPCHILEGVRLLSGCGSSYSMPSGHTMNSFAVAIVFSYFFRRSALLILPLAALVGFSRIYIGVHYPSDVLAGALLAGIVAWIVIDLQRWFFENYRKRPELTLFITSLAALTLFRYYYIMTGPLDLSPDEAHYWEWSRRLDLSYYSKGPMIAWLIAASTRAAGNTLIGVRLLAPVFLALSSIIIYLLTLDIFHKEKSSKLIACSAALMLQLTPLFAAFGVVMTIDAPFVFFWSLSLYLFRKAVKTTAVSSQRSAVSTKNFKLPLWFLLGVSVGLGLLTKYTMALFYICTFLFIISSKKERGWLKRKEPYIALLVSLLVFSPVLFWNAGHEWVTFRHTAGQAHIAEGLRISFKDFFEFIGSQIGIISPILFFMLFYGAIKDGFSPDRSRITRHASRFLFWFWFPVIAFFLIKSLQGKVQANWAMPGYITVFIAGPAYFLMKDIMQKRVKALAIAALMVLLLFSVITHYPSIISLPVKQDPTSRLMGWKEIGKKADAIYSDMRIPASKGVFIFSDKYQIASELAFYMESHPVTYNINHGRRMNQYDLWEGFENLLGFDAIFVRIGNKGLPTDIKNVFDSYSKEVFPVYRRDNKVLREYSIFKCYNFKGIKEREFEHY